MRRLLFLVVLAAAILIGSNAVGACGGFFCQNQPVDQTGERIVFTVNDDGTVTSLIEILYFGSADDFSWILPIPEAIPADALAVPEDGDLVFDELHALTDVRIIPPEEPDCALEFRAMAAMSDSADDGGVEIFASGEVGPFGFDIVGSEDPGALIGWLRDNSYRVTSDMEPLIDGYVDDQFAFIAMRLLDGETADSITPIEITFPSSEPMIPLKLTAVAAQPNMPVWVWVMADAQAVPANYAHMEIADEEITFFPFGGNDYTFLVQQRANAFDGHAFITEFAGPVEQLDVQHPWLVNQAESHPYMTRLSTYIDPLEMTIDPVFAFDSTRPDVSNVRDASQLKGLYLCERDGDDGFLDRIFGADSDAIDPMAGTPQVVAFTPGVERASESTGGSVSSDDRTTTTVESNRDAIDDQAQPEAVSTSPRSRSWLVFGGIVIAAFMVGLALIVRRRRDAGPE